MYIYTKEIYILIKYDLLRNDLTMNQIQSFVYLPLFKSLLAIYLVHSFQVKFSWF